MAIRENHVMAAGVGRLSERPAGEPDAHEGTVAMIVPGTRETTEGGGAPGAGPTREGPGAWRQQRSPRSPASPGATCEGPVPAVPGARLETYGGALEERLSHALDGVGSVHEVCRDSGARAASSGRSVQEALEDLALAVAGVAGRQPDFAETVAAAAGWADVTLGYLHRLTCHDPLTGLASLAHLQARVAELYRSIEHGVSVSTGHALVVLEPRRGPDGLRGLRGLTVPLVLARLGATARRVFPGGEIVAGAGGRVVVLAARTALESRAAVLRDLVADDPTGVRLWVEGLPDSAATAGALLDELARS